MDWSIGLQLADQLMLKAMHCSVCWAHSASFGCLSYRMSISIAYGCY